MEGILVHHIRGLAWCTFGIIPNRTVRFIGGALRGYRVLKIFNVPAGLALERLITQSTQLRTGLGFNPEVFHLVLLALERSVFVVLRGIYDRISIINRGENLAEKTVYKQVLVL